MYSLPLTHTTTIAMKVRDNSTDDAILEAFLAISGNDLIAKVDSPERRDWTTVRKIHNKEKTIKALKILNSQYLDGDTLNPSDVLKIYDDLVS